MFDVLADPFDVADVAVADPLTSLSPIPSSSGYGSSDDAESSITPGERELFTIDGIT